MLLCSLHSSQEPSVISKSHPTSLTCHSCFFMSQTLSRCLSSLFWDLDLPPPLKQSVEYSMDTPPTFLPTCFVYVYSCQLKVHFLLFRLLPYIRVSTLLSLPQGHCEFLRNWLPIYMISEVIVNTYFNRLIKNWLVVNTFWRQVKRRDRKWKQ